MRFRLKFLIVVLLGIVLAPVLFPGAAMSSDPPNTVECGVIKTEPAGGVKRYNVLKDGRTTCRKARRITKSIVKGSRRHGWKRNKGGLITRGPWFCRKSDSYCTNSRTMAIVAWRVHHKPRTSGSVNRTGAGTKG